MFEPFTLKARAKVNLALHVLGRRDDGYHDLDSLVAFADFGDQLAFSPADRFTITAEGPFASSLPKTDDNIIARAWRNMARVIPGLPPVAMRLTKNLPVASGIGGGSADAAAAIAGALRISGRPLDDEIRRAALELGADVPVCLHGKACRMRGIGEDIAALESFRPLCAVLINPLVPVATPDVFKALGLARGQVFGSPLTELDRPDTWRNDLAAPAIQVAPVIGDVLDWARALPGVSHAAMSGSGATVYAIREDILPLPQPPSGWWLCDTVLS